MENTNENVEELTPFFDQIINGILDEKLLTALTKFGEKVFADLSWRKNLKLEVFEALAVLIIRISTELEDCHPMKFKLFAQIFRFCRNSCAYSESNQKAVGLRTSLGNFAIRFARFSMSDGKEFLHGEEKQIAVLCALQMLCNSLTTCPTVCDYYMDILKYLNDLLVYMNHPVYKLSYFATMTLLEVLKIRPFTDIIAGVCHLTNSDIHDSAYAYSIFYTNTLCTFPEFIEKEFSELSPSNKLKAMENIANIPECHKRMTQSVLSNFIGRYNRHCETLFTTKSDLIDEIYLQELKSLGIIMVTMAGYENERLPYMRCNQELVTCTVKTLSKIHEFGKTGNNCFTAVEKLEYVAPTGTRNLDIQDHPTFLLKIKLLILLTYLCNKHEVNQNIIRKYGGINVILECTKIDARNPLLPQHAILALRCLLDGNAENQLYVKRMNKQGYAENPVLKEFGIITH